MQRAGKKAAASAQRRKKDFPAIGYTFLLLLFRLLFGPSGLRYAVDLLHEGKCSPFSIRAFHINDIPLHDLLYYQPDKKLLVATFYISCFFSFSLIIFVVLHNFMQR